MADQMIPPEYAAELERIQKQRAIAQMLQKQAMGFEGAQQGRGRIMPKTSPLAWMANMGTGYLANQADAAGAGKASEVQTRMLQDQNSEVEALLKTPQPEQYAKGQLGKFDRTRKLAEALLKRNDERVGKFADVTKDFDPSTAGTAALTGQLPAGNSYAPPPLKPSEFGTAPDGATYVRDFNRKNEGSTKFAPKGIVIDNAGEKAADKAVGAKIPERFDELTKTAQAAMNTMESARRIQGIIQEPAVLTGFGAGAREGVASLGALLGLTGPDAAAKTQALLAEMAGQTLANVKKLPGAITEKERPFLELASSGRIEFTKEAIQRLADISLMANHNLLVQTRSDYESAAASKQGAASGAAEVWPFPKGWEFSADPAKYIETGKGTGRYRLRDLGNTPAPAAPAPRERVWNPVTKRLE